jgi:methyl-accepting chemotaxis protein
MSNSENKVSTGKMGEILKVKSTSFCYKVLSPLFAMTLVVFVLLIGLISWKAMSTMEKDILDTSKIVVDGMYSLLENIDREIVSERELMLVDTKRRLTHLIEVANGIIEHHYNTYLSGEVSEQEAQSQAKEALRGISFGKNGYFWIDKEDYTLVMHPYLGDGEGKSREKLIDSNGKELLKDLVNGAVKEGRTFQEFWFPKERGGDAFPKLSYSMFFKPWGWIVSTGEYIDNIDEEMSLLEREAMGHLNDSLTDISYMNSYGFIRDGNHTFIAHQDRSLLNKSVPILDSETGEDLDSYFRSVKNGPVEYYYPRNGEGSYKKEGYVRYYEAMDLMIVYTVFQDDVDQIVGTLRNIVLFGGIISLLLLTAVTFLILRKVSKPLTSMTAVLEDISQGEGDLTARINVDGQDEFGLMATHFNDFTGKLHDMIAELKSVGNSSRDMGESLSVNITQISASTAEMASTIKALDDYVETQTKRVSSAGEEIVQIKGQISQVNSSLGQEEEVLEASSAAVTEMLASLGNLTRISTEKRVLINELADRARQGGSAMKETAEDIRDISGSVETIMTLAEVINGISDQINLLSMNAAIEAAHAGDSGKGFAVVADEIRKLADTTGEQTASISHSISGIASKIMKSGESSQKTEESINYITQRIDELTQVFNEIIGSLEEMTSGSSEITHSLELLETSSREVKDFAERVDHSSDSLIDLIEEVNKLSASNANGLRNVIEGTDQIVQVVKSLDQMGMENRETVAILDEKLNRFKVQKIS